MIEIPTGKRSDKRKKKKSTRSAKAVNDIFITQNSDDKLTIFIESLYTILQRLKILNNKMGRQL